MQSTQSRRRFLATLSSAGAVGVMGIGTSLAQEGPPETTTIRLARVPSICRAPQYMTEELLRSEGFNDVTFVRAQGTSDATDAVVDNDVDITMQYVGPSIMQVDAGKPLVVVAGIQPGCFELFGTERIRSVRDLKGMTVAVQSFAASAYTFIASMITYVGLDPRKDVTWAMIPSSEAKQLLAEVCGASDEKNSEIAALDFWRSQQGQITLRIKKSVPWSYRAGPGLRRRWRHHFRKIECYSSGSSATRL